MLPIVEPEGTSTAQPILLCFAPLIPASLLLFVNGKCGKIYAVGALALGLGLFTVGFRLATLPAP